MLKILVKNLLITFFHSYLISPSPQIAMILWCSGYCVMMRVVKILFQTLFSNTNKNHFKFVAAQPLVFLYNRDPFFFQGEYMIVKERDSNLGWWFSIYFVVAQPLLYMMIDRYVREEIRGGGSCSKLSRDQCKFVDTGHMYQNFFIKFDMVASINWKSG